MLSNATRTARIGAQLGYARVCQRAFGRSCPHLSHQPNAPISLDPTTQALLNSVDDMSLLKHKVKPHPTPRELEAFSVEPSEEVALEDSWTEEASEMQRKSPAALFGSQRIGAVVIPTQLQSVVTTIINDSDKSQLHADAMRLFAKMDSDGEQSGWEMQLDAKYRSYQQGARHAERDATAFVSIAMPGHYTAIYSVLDHLKQRMPPGFAIERVIDWGSASHTGLWASLYSFQKPSENYVQMSELEVAQSTVKEYVGIEKRAGLVAIGNRLLQDLPTSEDLAIRHRKSVKEEDKVSRELGGKTLGLSAFVLSSLPTPLARKQLVKEMWESGAHTLILMDHDTKAGFEAIAQAREYLLKLGRKEIEDPEKETLSVRGSHAVAPCSHDKACPLFNAGSKRVVCGFSQRMQRPSFVRLTKHSKVGHEDVQYSYVIIQRGARPEQVSSNAGRLGLVGVRHIQEQLAKSTPVKQLSLFDEAALPAVETPAAEQGQEIEAVLDSELQETLRKEAYHWPRLVVPPMKKSGHVILDSCTQEGKLMRLTIPKSQGKQPYYDARKSSWGDIFPHPPKNAPQERVVVHSSSGKVKEVQRDHIGKSRPERLPVEGKRMYDMVKPSVREAKKDHRRWDRLRKAESIWKVNGLEE